MGKKKIVVVIILVIILVLGGITAWLIVSGNFKNVVNVGTATPEVQKASLNRICDSKVVDTYNEVMNYQGLNTSSDEVGILNLQKDIKNKGGYETDPTCQTILFWIAVHNNKYEDAKTAYEAVSNLHGDGLFADSNLGSAAPLFAFKATLDSIAPEAQEGQ